MITIMFTEDEVRTLVRALEHEEERLDPNIDEDTRDHYLSVRYLLMQLSAEVTL